MTSSSSSRKWRVVSVAKKRRNSVAAADPCARSRRACTSAWWWSWESGTSAAWRFTPPLCALRCRERRGRCRRHTQAARRIEVVELRRIDREPEPRSDARRRLRVDTRSEADTVRHDERVLVARSLAHLGHVYRRRIHREDDVRVGAEILDNLRLYVDCRQHGIGESDVLERLGADADDQTIGAAGRPGGNAEAAERDRLAVHLRLDEVHRRRADER